MDAVGSRNGLKHLGPPLRAAGHRVVAPREPGDRVPPPPHLSL